MPTSLNFWKKRTGNKIFFLEKEQEIKSTTTNKSYDDSNIVDRDLGIMMINIATFTLHIINIV